MINDYTVNVVYKNRDMKPVCKRDYSLENFCQEQKYTILRTITDVENAFYSLQDESGKEDWPVEVMDEFQHIRHKLLDVANSIDRLPQNLCFKGQNINSVNGSDYIAQLVDRYLVEK